LSKKFWPPPQDAKWSELEENRHNHLISGALHDTDTQVTEYERYQFILYDKNGTEALLFRPRSSIIKIGMRLFESVLKHFITEETP